MAKDAKIRLDRKIVELEQRLNQLKTLREALNDEGLVADLAELFSTSKSAKITCVTTGNIGKIQKYFQSHNNEWGTVEQIVKDTKISIHSIREVLYKKGADLFERESHRGGGQQSKFRLKITENGDGGT